MVPGNTFIVKQWIRFSAASAYTVTVGTTPHGLAFDGQHMWVANN